VLLNHGSAVRKVGAMAVANTATVLSAQDEANAAGISNGLTPDLVGGLMPIPRLPAPGVPPIPPVAAALPPMPGEALSRALYGGSGSSSLHAFADQWDATSAQLRQLGDSTTQTGQVIETSWEDGHQQAGANVRRHAQWLTDMAEQASSLAGHARSVAEGFQTAKANTPSPQEFTQARKELNDALARFSASGGLNAVEVQAKSHTLAQQQSQATSAAMGYQSRIATATFPCSAQSLTTAPPIAGGTSTDDQIVGGSTGGPHIQMVDDKTDSDARQTDTPPPPAPHGQSQIGPFPVPPQVAAAAPPGVPRQTDPTGGLLTPQDLPPASPPPTIPGVNPPAPPGPPPLPSYGDLVKQVEQQGQQLNDMQNSAHNVTIDGLMVAGGAGCGTGAVAGAIPGALVPPLEAVTIPGGCVAGAITGAAGYLATIWGTNAVEGN
jgi:hypothetical protein